MNDPRIDKVIDMLNMIGAEMGIEFPQEEAEVPALPVEGMEEEMPMPDPMKERYLKAPQSKREEIDRKKVFGNR